MPVAKQFNDRLQRDKSADLDNLLLQSRAVSEFRRSKYDALRSRLIHLSMSILRIACVWDNMVSVDPYAKEQIYENKVLVYSRLYILPEILMESIFLMKVIFGPDHISLLLRQLLVVQVDLDIADNYYTRLGFESCAIVGDIPWAGRLNSPEQVRALGFWSFTLVFDIVGRMFLRKFVVGGERRKLHVIDAIASTSMLDVTPKQEVENLAFDVANQLLTFGGQDISPSEAERYLLKTVSSEADWCHQFNSDKQMKRWAKAKSQKYSKMIIRFQRKLAGLEIASFFTARELSVQYLLQLLQDSISKFRKLPTGLADAIGSTGDTSKIVEACKVIITWTRADVHQIRVHILQLMEAAEKVTGFFSMATGGAFPEVKSMLNPSWKMQQSSAVDRHEFSSEETIAIQDAMYVRAILEGHIDAHDL